jgi:hypothetical protein
MTLASGALRKLIEKGAFMPDEPDHLHTSKCGRLLKPPYFHVTKLYPLQLSENKLKGAVKDFLPLLLKDSYFTDFIDPSCTSGYIKFCSTILNSATQGAFEDMVRDSLELKDSVLFVTAENANIPTGTVQSSLVFEKPKKSSRRTAVISRWHTKVPTVPVVLEYLGF